LKASRPNDFLLVINSNLCPILHRSASIRPCSVTDRRTDRRTTTMTTARPLGLRKVRSSKN